MRIVLLLFSMIFNLGLHTTYAQTSTDDLHSDWNSLLQTYVDQKGNVDYKNLRSCSSKISAYIEKLGANEPTSEWTKTEKLAFYINLYNAATVKLILDNYPTKSIKDISKPWDKEWITIGSKTISLGDIEHKILRKMQEPRIHFAINCASYSCPSLSNQAFLAATMEKQLETATKSFINDPRRNKITSNKAEVSEIFKWFKKDFTTKGTLLDYISSYTQVPLKKDTKITYLDYNWSLNE